MIRPTRRWLAGSLPGRYPPRKSRKSKKLFFPRLKEGDGGFQIQLGAFTAVQLSVTLSSDVLLPAIRWQHSDTGFAAARSQFWSTASYRDERHERLGGVFSTSS